MIKITERGSYDNNPIDTTTQKCTNPENKDCDKEAKRTHRLVEKDFTEKEYPMCNECYESWCYD